MMGFNSLYSLYQKVTHALSNRLATLFPQYFNKPLIDFFNRLKKVQNDPMDPALEKRLSQEDFNKILDFFLNKRRKEQIGKMAVLANGGAYRLDKHQTKLPRTLNVLRSPEGEFLLMLETKRKLKDNSKDESLVQICGIAKCGKPAWRSDIIEEYFNLVRRLKPSALVDELQESAEEVALSQRYSPQLIVQQLIGALFYSHNKATQPKVSIYAKKGQPLDKFIQSGRYKLLSEVQKRKIEYLLFLIIKEFHDDNSVYQDLKFENIIVFENKEGEIRIKLTDLGLADQHNDPLSIALATLTFQSPEISYYHSQETSNWHKYFNDAKKGAQLTLGYQLQSHCSGDKKEYSAPHKANDMWALGIARFYLQFSHYPKNNAEDLRLIKEDSLLSGLLEPDRNKRIDIDSAISLFLKQNLASYPILDSVPHASEVQQKALRSR